MYGFGTLPEYEATAPVISKDDINDANITPKMYTQPWSDTLNDIVMSYCRENGILEQMEQVIPTTIIHTVAEFYSGDKTKKRTFSDFIDALLICRYFSSLKRTKPADAEDKRVRKLFKLDKRKTTVTASLVFRALQAYKKGEFQILNSTEAIETNFKVAIVDHELNRCNLQKLSFPRDLKLNISEDEAAMIAAVRDSLRLHSNLRDLHSTELQAIMKRGHFEAGKAPLEENGGRFKIISLWQQCVTAVGEDGERVYMLFVGRFFSVIIRDKPAEFHTLTNRSTMDRYRAILEQLQQSGL